MNKKYHKVIIAVVLITISIILIRNIVPASVKVEKIVRSNPSELEIRFENKIVIYKNKNEINNFSKLIENKIAYRASDEIEEDIRDKSIIRLDYGYKGNSMIVDNKDRTLIYVYKSQIRNKSILHWLWWKIDNFYGNGKSYIVYWVESDIKIANQIKKIKELSKI